MKKIAIHSVPRSGSTWLGSIFDSDPKVIYKFQPLFSYLFKSRLSEVSNLSEIQNFFFELERSKDDFIDQTEAKNKGSIPTFPKVKAEAIVYKEVRYHHILENLMDTDSNVKVVGLIRNPLSTLYSWLKAPKEFRSDLKWNFSEEWRFAPKKNLSRKEEFNGYEKWKEVSLLFHKLLLKYPDRFYLIKYEKLLKNTQVEVKALFDFCGLEVTRQTWDFLDESSQVNTSDPYSVFKSGENDEKWKSAIDGKIVAYIKKDLSNSILEQYIT